MLFRPPVVPALKRRVLSLALANAPARPRIVEVGTMRYAADTDDGRSTLHFARHAREQGGTLASVDVDAAAVEVARKGLAEHGLTAALHRADGAKFLATSDEPIDVLYLDSGDDPALTLEQLRAAWPRLTQGAVVVVDDCHPYGGNAFGKGTRALPWMREQGLQVALFDLGYYRMAAARRDGRALRGGAVLHAHLALVRLRARGPGGGGLRP